MEEPPTDYYCYQLGTDLCSRHPKTCLHTFWTTYLVSLEAFLDKSILFGFSYGSTVTEPVAEARSRLPGRQATSPLDPCLRAASLARVTAPLTSGGPRFQATQQAVQKAPTNVGKIIPPGKVPDLAWVTALLAAQARISSPMA